MQFYDFDIVGTNDNQIKLQLEDYLHLILYSIPCIIIRL